MLLLVTSAHPTLLGYPSDHLGRLVQPRHTSSIEATAASGMSWAADNDCFQRLDAAAYVRMIDRLAGLPGCLFVTAPDVVGNAKTTLALFGYWKWALIARGLPVGLVAQDGLTPETRPWDHLDALFIGGTTEWKLGPHARMLATAAKARGKWLHMGRVNTYGRLEHARRLCCDSADGSQWSRWRDTYLPSALRFLAQPDRQLELCAG